MECVKLNIDHKMQKINVKNANKNDHQTNCKYFEFLSSKTNHYECLNFLLYFLNL